MNALMRPVGTPDPQNVGDAAGKRPTILVVDDDVAFRQVVCLRLRRLGYEVADAGDGALGLLLAHQVRPAAILLDLDMPGVDGIDFLDMFRADRRLRATPVILVSAMSDTPKLREALVRGLDCHLVKGRFSTAELLAHVFMLAGPPPAVPSLPQPP